MFTKYWPIFTDAFANKFATTQRYMGALNDKFFAGHLHCTSSPGTAALSSLCCCRDCCRCEFL